MSPARILIVEDEAVVSKDICQRLQSMGYEPSGWAVTGDQALVMAKEQRPDLILMDIRLIGKMDGIEAALEIRREFRIPVVFLTAHSEDETLERAKLAEPYGYILKPFDDRDLKSVIEMALHKRLAEEEIRRLNRLYALLSHVSQTIVRVESREELFEAVCRLVVEKGKIDLVRIGRLDADCSQIKILAQCEIQGDTIDGAGVCVCDPIEIVPDLMAAIQQGSHFIYDECSGQGYLHPATHSPASPVFKSCGWFPFRFQGQIWGIMNIGVAEAGFFKEHEIELLKEVVEAVSFALDKFEAEAQRARSEDVLRESEERLRLFIEHAPAALAHAR